MEYPQSFIDYLCNKFGLEWLDYADEQCYLEWLNATESERKMVNGK